MERRVAGQPSSMQAAREEQNKWWKNDELAGFWASEGKSISAQVWQSVTQATMATIGTSLFGLDEIDPSAVGGSCALISGFVRKINKVGA